MVRKLIFWGVLAAVLYGAFMAVQWFRTHNYMKEELQRKPGIVERTGSFEEFDMDKSTHAPFCTGDACKDVMRYFVKIKGDRGAVNVSTDFNTKSRAFSSTVLCNPSDGAVIATDPNVPQNDQTLCAP